MTESIKFKEVLIVDDDNLNLDLVCQILSVAGFITTKAINGVDAIKKVKRNIPDLIIIDAIMPHLDGFETCRLLKDNFATQNIPIIFMSGVVDATQKVTAFKLGANDYITKPFEKGELLARVERQIELLNLRRTLENQNYRLQSEIEQKYETELTLLDTNEKLSKANKSLSAEVDRRKTVEVELQTEILERIEIERQLKQSLVEKDLLLKEVHHRVKNNLFIVSSLLETQTGYIKDLQVQKLLNNSQNRIISMALIHEQLHCDTGLFKIDFKEYLTTLANYLINSYLTQNISLQVDIEQNHLNIETVNPCGLIVNELISNAVEHAFVDRELGNISVSFKAITEQNFILIVKDDGVGFPADKNFFQSDSLGLELVTTLVEQLEGKIEVNSCNGTEIKIIFTEQEYETRI